MITLAVALAAGLGALLRYLVDQLLTHHSRTAFPLGTFVINVSGSFVLGLSTGLALHHGLPTTPTLIIGTGFAGGYTTLSTWAWETLALSEDGEIGIAALNVFGSVAAGLAAATAGLGVALL